MVRVGVLSAGRKMAEAAKTTKAAFGVSGIVKVEVEDGEVLASAKSASGRHGRRSQVANRCSIMKPASARCRSNAAMP